ncbi:MAG: beta-ketoacyl synthase N-terminal-like domain-containing protein [Acidobacteriota bacterium]
MDPIRQETPHVGPEPIAIIGIGCWLPGNITSVESLLDALRTGRDLVSEIPADRWNVDSYYDADPLAPGKTYVRRGGFVKDIDCFDAGFFGISDTEAARMDPQQRMVLQTVWHALEHAGQSADELAHSNSAVFLAMMNTNNYSHLKAVFEGARGIVAYDAMADAMSITSGRIAHLLDLEGPAISLDTACSSSLVALHLARQSILVGDCDLAIVVGVNAILHPGLHVAFSKVGLMSAIGRCAAFDASADGYIRGEGCVAVVLRRQSRAIAHGDTIIASIVGTAVNQDGHTPAVTAPNGRAQERVMRSAMARLGVSPGEISYVEAHGTGTPVGDPIEMGSIANVFGPGRPADSTLYVGSVKSNFGHIESAAGMLGLVKAALSLQHGEIYPSLHFKQWNPSIELGHAPITVPTTLVPWPRTSTPRLAGVNSFGYSGTNAHAILHEAPLARHADAETSAGQAPLSRPSEIVVLSAKSKASLEELVDQWVGYLDRPDSASLPNIAFTADTGRSHLKLRLAAVGSDKAEIAGKLKAWREGRVAKGLASGQTRFRLRPKVAFMFTGQGAQYAGMGQELYRTEARFAAVIDRVAATMDAELGVPLKSVLFGPEARTCLTNTRYVQPALFAIEYALAELLRHWGVEPDFVIGHSVGEITAACIAGVLDLDDAIRFVAARGRLMGDLPEGGKMLAIGTDLEQARRWVKGREADVSIATVNGPQAIVVSGTASAVDAIAELAAEAGLRTTPLDVSHAFHSPLMDPILSELAGVAASMRISPPRIPVVSNVTGDFHGERIDAGYWSDHVRQAVLFHAGMEKIVEAGAALVVEIGPHPALTPAVATSFEATKTLPVPTLKRDGKDFTNLLGALATLFVNGATMNLDRLFWNPQYERISLPLYPFRKDRHWLMPTTGLDVLPESPLITLPELPPLHPLLGQVTTRTWQRTVFQVGLTTTSPWTDHRILGTTVFPATAYLDLAARGFAALAGHEWCAVTLTDVSFERPLLLTYRKPQTVSLTLERTGRAGETRFVIAAADNEADVYCQGRMTSASDAPREPLRLAGVKKDRVADMQIGAFYSELRKAGLEYGAAFSTVRELWMGESGTGEALGRVSGTQPGSTDGQGLFANAVLLDGCAHVIGGAAKMLTSNGHGGAFVPVSLESITLWRELPAQSWSHVQVTVAPNGRSALASMRISNDSGDVLAEFRNFELKQTSSLSAAQPGRTPVAAPKAASTVAATKSGAELVECLRPLNRPQRVREVANWLMAEIKETMGQAADGLDIDSLPSSTAFLEIGLDSLLVTELQRRIQEKLKFRFKPTQGMDYQTIDSMAEFLLDGALAAELTREAARAS